jgi:hypothetical protein
MSDERLPGERHPLRHDPVEDSDVYDELSKDEIRATIAAMGPRQSIVNQIERALREPGIPVECAYPGCTAKTDNRLRWSYLARWPGGWSSNGLPWEGWCTQLGANIW